MNKHQAQVMRNLIAFGGLGLAAVVALSLVEVVVAQSQLPGTALTTGPGNDLRPAWSADGTQIAFFSNVSGNNEIWVMDADGANQRQLTNDPADDRRPAWSPDGAWIAFDSDRAGGRDLWIMDAEGGQVKQLTTSVGQDSFAAWNPDGATIAYYIFDAGTTDIWTIEVSDFLQGGEAGQPRRLTIGAADERRNECTFACHVPAWSPDGTRIAFPRTNDSQVWVVGLDGSDPVLVSNDQTRAHFPWWTADGKLIYLTEHANSNQEPVNDVWVMDADGKNASLLFPGLPHGGPLYWKPDGSMTIVFHSPRAGNFDIYTVALGQDVSTPQPMAATPPADEVFGLPATAAPESVAANPTAAPSAGGPTGLSVPVLIGALAAIAGGGFVAVYLARKRRSS